MAKRIYQKKQPRDEIIKVRLQHTEPGDQQYAGNQATAIYLEVDADTLLKMFEYLSISQQAV